jgi:hypothetical protein
MKYSASLFLKDFPTPYECVPMRSNSHSSHNIKMKTSSLFTPTLVAAGLLSAATVTTHAQTWQTLLPNPNSAPTWEGTSLLIDPFSSDPTHPDVFVGCASDSGSVLHLDNNGFVPTFVDTDLGTALGMGFNQIDSTLYAVGFHLRVAGAPSSSSNQDVWSVRKSVAGGALNTWMQDDTFYLSTTALSMARAITTDASGIVYVCGAAYLGSSSSHWVVRELPFVGSWRTVVDTAGKSSNGDAHGMLSFRGNSVNPAKAVFAVGTLNSQWTVMRSQDKGASWQTVDAWSPGKNIGATAVKAACDNAGNIYVVGYRGVALTGAGWVVRESNDGGNTWFPVLDVPPVGTYSKASSVSIDGAGNVWVTGVTDDSSGNPHWTVLQNGLRGTLSANNAAFLQLRQLPFGAITSNPAGGVTSDTYGNVFVAGQLDEYPNQYIGLQRWQ